VRLHRHQATGFLATILPDPRADSALGDARRRLQRLLARVRREQAAALAVRALLVGAAAMFAAAAALLLVDLLAVLGPGARRWLRWLPPSALGAGVLVVLLRESHALRALPLVLLLERRHPRLQHLLPTVLASSGTGALAGVLGRRASTELAALTSRGAVRWGLGPLLAPAAASAALVSLLLIASPGGAGEALARWLYPASAAAWSGRAVLGVGGSAPGSAAPRFERLRVEVTPPAYTGLPAWSATGDEPLALLPGSAVRVRGPLPAGAHAVQASLAGNAGRTGDPAAIDRDGGEWRTEWTHASSHRALVVEALTAEGAVLARRVLPLLLREDRAPTVELLDPDRDLVMAQPRGIIEVRARATDDFGVERFDLVWVRSRGSVESFQFEEFTTSWAQVEGSARERTGVVSLDLAALQLQPGDALHLRAVARDANGGGGTGVSRTRVVRIARADEIDDINTVIGFPLEGEESPVLSQRMIIVLTEQLLQRASRLDAHTLGHEAAGIAHEQARLRQRVGDQIYIRATGGVQDIDEAFGAEEVGGGTADHEHSTAAGAADHAAALTPEDRAARERALLEAASRATGRGTLDEIEHIHDESMILAVNRPLMEIYDAMWSAERELRLVQPRDALPHENRALDLLQALRQADRVYSRAPQRAPPVDVAAARGTGRLVDAAPAGRSAAERLASGAALLQHVEELEQQLAVLDAAAAGLALSAAAVELLGGAGAAPAAGGLLARAADHAARGERTAALELLGAVRRVLAPESHVRYESGNWDSAPLVPANLIHSLAQYTEIPVEPEGVIVDLGSAEVFRHPFLYLTGHLPVRFTEAESRNLEAYVRRGGFLFVDDHNHDIDGAFHRTVTAELARIFGPRALRELPNDHELYRAFFVFEDGPPTTSHELNGWGDGLVHEHLFAIQQDGRIGILYSNKDYSSEWNYHAVNKRFLGIDNTRFGVNVLVYALTR
jgi:hypothetical protein